MIPEDYVAQARTDAVLAMRSLILDVINTVMAEHGDDPQSYAIVGAALIHVLKDIRKRNGAGAEFLIALLAIAEEEGFK